MIQAKLVIRLRICMYSLSILPGQTKSYTIFLGLFVFAYLDILVILLEVEVLLISEVFIVIVVVLVVAVGKFILFYDFY